MMRIEKKKYIALHGVELNELFSLWDELYRILIIFIKAEFVLKQILLGKALTACAFGT